MYEHNEKTKYFGVVMTISRSLNQRVLILGASGMLGNAMFRFFSQSRGYSTFGTVRSDAAKGLFQNPRVLILDEAFKRYCKQM